MKRILFVDDEVAVLDGLRDRLRKQRREWEMVFASSGPEALALCERGAFDVVVSDMRMPGMDGAELMRAIKERYPGAIRVVLSGHAEREAVMRALPVAHQYMSKPCDAEVLRNAISRACALQSVIADEGVRSLVGRVERLPSVPTIYVALMNVLARESPSIAEVVRVVERDPAMCLKILQVVNSAFFGLPRRVSAMAEAIGYLGLELLKSLVLASQIFSAAEGAGQHDASLARVQRHSVLVGQLARRIVPAQADDAFMAGMLHDVGRIVLALGDADLAARVDSAALDRGAAPFRTEHQALGVTHADVGAYLLATWGVPFAIVDAVAAHHEPSRATGARSELMAALHVADALATEAEAAAGEAGRVAVLDEGYVQAAGWGGRLADWRALAATLRTEGGP